MPATITGSQSGTVGLVNALTVLNTTSGTSIDFTGIPSGARRITILLNGVGTNGTSYVQMQVGSGSIATTGYNVTSSYQNNANINNNANSTAGFIIQAGTANTQRYGSLTLCLLTGGTWAGNGSIAVPPQTATVVTAGIVALAGALDRVRITTVNGTDAFNAGSVNVLYE